MKNNTVSATRIDVADVLRGVAILGIVLVHFVEHFNFYAYPDTATQGALLNFTDQVVWDSIFFLFGGKGYAIFALLFGFSFFIQDNNQRIKGNDFRLRFVWRLVLLFVIGLVNSLFYPGDILVLYSILGLVLVLVCRLPDRAVGVIALVLLLQPMELWNTVHALIDPAFVPSRGWFDASFGDIAPVQAEGSFGQMLRTNIGTGLLANMDWYVTNGRITQTAGLFVLGMLVGRRGWLLGEEKNLKLWFKAICWSAVVFFATEGLRALLPEFVESRSVLRPLTQALKSYENMAMMIAMVGSLIILFYTTRMQGVLMKLAPYGRMSLTNYLSQSVIGTMLFYHWGFSLYQVVGITYSILMGAVFFCLQLAFCRWWMKSHRHGPLEYLWKKATWIGS
jgi:uncharacterized protein